MLKKIVIKSGFILNNDKERCVPNHEVQSVVGLRVNRKLPKIDREKKRDWRRRKYSFDKFGSELFIEDKAYEREKNIIQGQQSYINYVNSLDSNPHRNKKKLSPKQ